MKLNEFLTESQIQDIKHLEEGPIGAVGTAVGKGVGAVARGAGAVAGGIAGIGSAFKKGFQTGRATVAGEPDPNAKTAQPKASTSTSRAQSSTASTGAQTGTQSGTAQPDLKPGQPVRYVNDKGQTKDATFVKQLATRDAQGDPQVQVKSGKATFAIDRDRIQTDKTATTQPGATPQTTTSTGNQNTATSGSQNTTQPTAQGTDTAKEPEVGQSAILAKLQQQVDKLTPDQQMQVLKTLKTDIDKTAAKLPPAKPGRRTTKPAAKATAKPKATGVKTTTPAAKPAPKTRLKTTKPAVT